MCNLIKYLKIALLLLALTSLLAGILLAAFPIGVCSHSIFQWACVGILYGPIWLFYTFCGQLSGADGERILLFGFGIIQALIFGIVYLVINCMTRSKCGSRSK